MDKPVWLRLDFTFKVFSNLSNFMILHSFWVPEGAGQDVIKQVLGQPWEGGRSKQKPSGFKEKILKEVIYLFSATQVKRKKIQTQTNPH